jgi:hypothetical protein
MERLELKPNETLSIYSLPMPIRHQRTVKILLNTVHPGILFEAPDHLFRSQGIRDEVKKHLIRMLVKRLVRPGNGHGVCFQNGPGAFKRHPFLENDNHRSRWRRRRRHRDRLGGTIARFAKRAATGRQGRQSNDKDQKIHLHPISREPRA